MRLSSHDRERTSDRLESWHNSARVIEKGGGNKEKIASKQLFGSFGPGASAAVARAGPMAPSSARAPIDDDNQEDEEEQNDLKRYNLSQQFGIHKTSSLHRAANSPLGKRSRSVVDEEMTYPSDSTGSSGSSGTNRIQNEVNNDQHRGMAEYSGYVKDVAMRNLPDSEPSFKVDKGKGKARASELGESLRSSSINASSGEVSSGRKKKQ